MRTWAELRDTEPPLGHRESCWPVPRKGEQECSSSVLSGDDILVLFHTAQATALNDE